MELNQTNDVVQEIKNVENDEMLKNIIEKHFEQLRTESMKLGAYYISMGVYAAIQKNLNKASKYSLNDYRRCIKDILKIVKPMLKTEQNDSED